MFQLLTFTRRNFRNQRFHPSLNADLCALSTLRPKELVDRRRRATDFHFLDCIAQRIDSAPLLIGYGAKTEDKSKDHRYLDCSTSSLGKRCVQTLPPPACPHGKPSEAWTPVGRLGSSARPLEMFFSTWG